MRQRPGSECANLRSTDHWTTAIWGPEALYEKGVFSAKTALLHGGSNFLCILPAFGIKHSKRLPEALS
jgi:hypothetical protein